MSIAVAPRVILRRNRPRAHGDWASSQSVLPSMSLLVEVDIETLRRHRQQLEVVHFLGFAADQVHQHVASPRDRRDDVATTLCITVSVVASMIVPPRRMR